MSVPVVCVSSHEPQQDYYRFGAFKRSLARFKCDPVVLGFGEPWQGLMTKPNHFMAWLRAGHCAPDDRVILVDCWDVIFCESPEFVSERCRHLFGDAVVFNAEKACWPLAELAVHFEDQGTPWRYLNGGVMCGPAGRLLAMFESMNLESYGFDRVDEATGLRIEPNDAVPLVMTFVNQPVPVVVDGKCQVMQSFSACSADEFDITSLGVVNKLTGTVPAILHFNGASKNDIMPVVLQTMNL